jgi:hypothetical protein
MQAPQATLPTGTVIAFKLRTCPFVTVVPVIGRCVFAPVTVCVSVCVCPCNAHAFHDTYRHMQV